MLVLNRGQKRQLLIRNGPSEVEDGCKPFTKLAKFLISSLVPEVAPAMSSIYRLYKAGVGPVY